MTWPRPRARLAGALTLLAAYVAIAYGRGLPMVFLNDDYIFLERVRSRSFLQLWVPDQLIFYWYRPWSRELHYWTLFHLAGLDERFYHAANFVLWAAVVALYFRFALRLAGRSAAILAVACLAALGLWSSPLLWVAGVQDLWMLLFGLLFLHAVASGRRWPGLAALVLALLSKETAAVLPAVAGAYLWIVERRPARSVLRRLWPELATLIVWATLHPTLSRRMFGDLSHAPSGERPLTTPLVLAKTLLAQVNLESLFAPENGWGPVIVKGLLGAAALAGFLLLARPRAAAPMAAAGRPHDSVPRDAAPARAAATAPVSMSDAPSRPVRRVVLFGCAWALLGWSVLLLPSIGWHAYYGVLGTLGCWLALAVLLAIHRRTACMLVIALALLREAQAATPSWDWGTDWFQTRAASLLGGIRERLFELHPRLPAHTRLFFTWIPNNIGFLAGNGPAVRIWYDDPTLQARFYSAYSPRERTAPSGPDLFFRFDTVQVLVEIKTGAENVLLARQWNLRWQRDHQVLASMFVRTGNTAGAAAEYAKLAAAFPGRSDYALFAGATHEGIGELPRAQAFYAAAAKALGDSAVQARRQVLLRALQPEDPPRGP